MTKITFCMPSVQLLPSGGYKVVYEYANRLALEGNSVNILYPATVGFHRSSIRNKLKAIIYYVYFVFKPFKIGWFKFEHNVNNIFVWSLDEKYIPSFSDIIIATGASTAYPVSLIEKVKKKYYFIQGYETWSINEADLIKTYKLPLKKIVIADYLLEKVEEAGEKAKLVYNGFDFDYFRMYNSPSERNKYQIVMPYNKARLKGCDVGFKALELVHKKYPEVRVLLYGVHRPKKMPPFCTFYLRPEKKVFNQIYNTSAIFLGPSFTEGFCLTVSEAMQCGCAVVCTNIGGYTVVCKNRKTALVGEVGDPQSLADLIVELIEDDSLRYSIANSGHNMIEDFTWEKAFTSFKKAIEL